MRISWNWLQQYIETDLTPHQAADILTSTGLECEGVELHEPVKGMLQGVVVGHVLAVVKHPDADRLSVCGVDLGEGDPVQIVCGAANVAAGQKVVVAKVGSVLNFADGTSITIKKSKIRGVESHGMICAEDELGLGTGHEGILVLDPKAEVGLSAADHFALRSDHVLEIGLTPNRTDAMGHFGVARDLRAALVHRRGASMELKLPDVAAFAQDLQGKTVAVEVQDPFACPRYAGLTLTEVKVGPSPTWLQERLLAIGAKPINNVVDVTNYVQHELGQPLHAFDAGKLHGDRIVVRMATAGEPFTTLDAKERKLDAQDLVIADGEKPVCIAGVFGGAESGVSESTTTVFLESACFEPGTVRRTARRHGLNTDASFRFERGVDPEFTVYALKRAALLLKEVAGAQVASAITDIDQRVHLERMVKLSFSELDRTIGVRMDRDAVVAVLELLDFRIHDRNDRGVEVQVPSYRVDVHRPADVIEEILRIHGYDEVPVPARLMVPPVHHGALTVEQFGTRTMEHLASRGMREIMAPSLVNGARCVSLGAATAEQLVAMQNPLSAELDVLRPTMLFGALASMAYNINRQQRDLRTFERGRTYVNAKKGAVEQDMLAIALTGARSQENWRGNDRKSELADVKEELESLLHRMGLSGEAKWEPCAHPLLVQAHSLSIGGRSAGVLGTVNKVVLKAFDVAQPVHFAEVNESVLLDACRAQRVSYSEIAKFPAVRRDLSLLLDSGVRFDQLRDLAFGAERKLLLDVGLFDVYEGDKVPKGKKSYALSFQLQDSSRTLTDEQVEKSMGRIRHALEKGVGAEVRS
jgi:phenylalanyl-tRNA synthetase beta chain